METEYHMLDRRCINTNSLYIDGKKGDFSLVKMDENEPKHMFRIIKKDSKKMILEQIDCDSIHWSISLQIGMRGPNEICRLKCQYFKECPVRDYILLLKSGFE